MSFRHFRFQKQAFLLLSLLSCSFPVLSQSFKPAFEHFSSKKLTYVQLENGTQINGRLKGLSYKKGLIRQIKIKTVNKVKIKPDEILNLYIPPSKLSQFNQLSQSLFDAQTWGKTDLNKDFIQQGHVYFEKSPVKIKKKIESLVLQLLNPEFCSSIKVYHDPLSQKSASLAVKGITVAGGNAKSYFIKKGAEPAFKLHQKDYKKVFFHLFGDCPHLLRESGDRPKWTDLALHIFTYTKTCQP